MELFYYSQQQIGAQCGTEHKRGTGLKGLQPSTPAYVAWNLSAVELHFWHLAANILASIATWQFPVVHPHSFPCLWPREHRLSGLLLWLLSTGSVDIFGHQKAFFMSGFGLTVFNLSVIFLVFKLVPLQNDSWALREVTGCDALLCTRNHNTYWLIKIITPQFTKNM